jgi:hypothetical protein
MVVEHFSRQGASFFGDTGYSGISYGSRFQAVKYLNRWFMRLMSVDVEQREATCAFKAQLIDDGGACVPAKGMTLL